VAADSFEIVLLLAAQTRQTGIEVASLLLGASVRFFANARQSRKRVEREVHMKDFFF
jgi:hypothetical protein